MDDGSLPSAAQASRPVVGQYCPTFLKPEMRHIYRQITGLRTYRPVVFAQKRENTEEFPFGDVVLVPKPRSHGLRRIWQRHLLDRPLQISTSEAMRLKGRIERARARLVHIYFGHIGVQLMPFIEVAEVPVVVSFHGADAMVNLHKKKYREETIRMLEAVDGVLVRSESIAQRLYALGCDPGKVRIHRTGIPMEHLPHREREFPENGGWRLVQACRLIPKKGLRTTILAFAGFLKRFPRSELTIAGEGPLKEELEAFVIKAGLSGRVRFTGFLGQGELRELYYRSHAFVHPSELGPDGNQEGVPNSMLEAMSTGLPVLATRHGGIPEAVEDGVSGTLVGEADDVALAEAMCELAADRQRYAAMGRAAAAAVGKQYEISSQVRKLEEFYAELMNGSE